MPAKIFIDGHAFNNENEYRRYCGLVQLLKEGRIDNFEVNPDYELRVDGSLVANYAPTFKFFDKMKQQDRYVHMISRGKNQALEFKIRLFEILYHISVERWG